DAVAAEAHHGRRGVELRDEAGGVARRAAGQLALLKQDDVGPPGPGQVVGDAAPRDAAADDNDSGSVTLHVRHARSTGPDHSEAGDYSGAAMTDLDGLLDLVPALRERHSVAELAGGLTNTNYKVETPGGAFVVRVSAKDAGLLAIDRENEYLNTVAAADAGVGAAVIDYLPEKSLLVLEFIEGTTQTSEDMPSMNSR